MGGTIKHKPKDGKDSQCFGDQMSETLPEALMLCCYSVCLIEKEPKVEAARPTVCKAAETGSGGNSIRCDCAIDQPMQGAQPAWRRAKCYQLCTSGGGQKEKANKITGMAGLGTL